jgi:hypothetical protein
MSNETTNSDTSLLLTFIQEHWEEMRHVENQRLAIANLILILAAGTIAFIAQKGFGQPSLVLSMLLIFLGAYGGIATLKLYERYHHSQNRLDHWYKKIDALNPGAQFLHLREEADKAHAKKFAFWNTIRVHWLWLAFHSAIGVLGLCLLWSSVTAPPLKKSSQPKPQALQSKAKPVKAKPKPKP